MSPNIVELNKLKNVQQSLDKSENVSVEQISRFDNGLQISEYYKDSTASRNVQLEKLQTNVKRFVSPLQKVQKLVRKENIANVDLKLVKKEMLEIQGSIQDLKNNTRTTLDSLKKEEEQLLEDMHVFELKFEEWNKPLTSFPKIQAPKKTSSTSPKNISPEVTEFMNFVAESGGHENGWSVEDHNLFLKALNKSKDVTKVAEFLHTLLPDISHEEVIDHYTWYEIYINLKERQRKAIQNWRKSKSEISDSQKTSGSKCEKKLIKSFATYVKKDELEQQIAAWKAGKRAVTLKKQEEKLKEENKKKELEKEQKQQCLLLRTEVHKWKKSRKIAEDAERKKQLEIKMREQEEKAARANKMIKQFRSQDELIVQKRMQMRRPNVPKIIEEKPVEKPRAKRDLQRLLKPTKQWILRSFGADAGDSGDNENNRMSLQGIPKLGIPEWRKNIM